MKIMGFIIVMFCLIVSTIIILLLTFPKISALNITVNNFSKIKYICCINIWLICICFIYFFIYPQKQWFNNLRLHNNLLYDPDIEIFLILFIVTRTSNHGIFMNQHINITILLFLLIISIVCFITILIKINKSSLDLLEAESDAVTDYIIEYTGITFDLFYLNKYINLFISVVILGILFLNGLYDKINYCYILLNELIPYCNSFNLNYFILEVKKIIKSLLMGESVTKKDFDLTAFIKNDEYTQEYHFFYKWKK